MNAMSANFLKSLTMEFCKEVSIKSCLWFANSQKMGSQTIYRQITCMPCQPTIISHDAKLTEYIVEWCCSRWKTHESSIAQTAINNEPQVSRKHIHANPLETREIAPTWHQLVVDLRFTFSTRNCSIWSVFQLSILHSFSTCRNKQELRYQGNITSSILHIDLTTSHSDGQRSSSCCHVISVSICKRRITTSKDFVKPHTTTLQNPHAP
jgi:hypothetical protein